MSETLEDKDTPACKTVEGVRIAARYLRDKGVSGSFQPVCVSPPIRTFDDLILPEEVAYSFQVFFIRDVRQAKWFRIGTEDRLLYAAHAQPLADLLTAEGFNLTVDRGWRWLRGEESPRPEGLSSCKTQYGLFVSPSSYEKPKPFIRETVCLSKDPRADRTISELIEDAGSCRHIAWQTSWTETGFSLSCSRKEDAATLEGIFPDCDPKIVKQKRADYRVECTFPI